MSLDTWPAGTRCPNCGKKMDCLGGFSAHPDNWYCDHCGWEAWTHGCGGSKPSPYEGARIADEIAKNAKAKP